jgi:hypothetical protein
MARPQLEVPPALEGNDFVITAVGTSAWGAALIVLLALRHQIPAASHWWIWTCVAGFGMGLFGLAYVPHLKRSRARAAARRAASAGAGGRSTDSENAADRNLKS